MDGALTANVQENKEIQKLAGEGKDLTRKRQKLIRIADKSADGWKVVEEYMSDELASASEDEKRLKRAKKAASRKKRHTAQAHRDPVKRFKSALAPNDQQLFRGKNFNLCCLLSSHWVLCFFSWMGPLANHPTYCICLFFFFLRAYLRGKMIYVRLNVVN